MSSSKKLQSLESYKQIIESQIIGLEQLRAQCNKEIKAETNWDKRTKLNTKIDNYSIEITERYEKLDEIEKQIEELKLNDKSLSSNDYLDNPKNQQLLKVDKNLRNIDFEKALETFKRITSQFNKEGDVALFFMEKRLINQGDLFLQKLKNDVASETYNIHRQSFNSHRVIYTSGNLEKVVCLRREGEI